MTVPPPTGTAAFVRNPGQCEVPTAASGMLGVGAAGIALRAPILDEVSSWPHSEEIIATDCPVYQLGWDA